MTKGIVPFLCMLMPFVNVSAQFTRASISQDEIDVGERVTLSYSLPIKQGKPLFKAYKRFIPTNRISTTNKTEKAASEIVEILQKFRDTILQTQEGKIWTGNYEITVWDSGTFVIPGPKIQLGNDELQFPAVCFNGRFATPIKGIDTYDIKESFADLPPKTFGEKLLSFLSAYGWMLLILIAIFSGWLIYKRIKNKNEEKHAELSLFEFMLLQLDELEKKELWNKGMVKSHYSDLSALMRSYLSKIYQLQLLERTTSEILLLLERKVDAKPVYAAIKSILEVSDLVKFAKYSPDEATIKEHLHQSIGIITQINNEIVSNDDE